MNLFLVILTLFFPFLIKYSFVITNQYSQIPIILSYLKPNYLINDWYVNISKSFGPRTFFALYFAAVSKITSLPLTFFLHYLLYIFFVAYSSYRLSYLLFNKKFIALVSTICILFGTSFTLGGNILVTQDLSAPQLPLSLTLLGLVFLLEEKYLWSIIAFFVASILHPLVGIIGTSIIILSFITFQIWQKKSLRVSFYKLSLPLIFLYLSIILIYLTSYRQNAITDQVKIDILAFMRNPHHFVPAFWALTDVLIFFLFILCSSLLLFINKKNYPRKILSFIVTFSIIICFLLALGHISITYLSFYPLVIIQPFRLTVYLYWLGAIFIIGNCLNYSLKYKYYQPFLSVIFLSNLKILNLSGKTQYLALLLVITLVVLFKKLPKKIFVFSLIIYFYLLNFHQKFNYNSYVYNFTPETTVALWVKNQTDKNAIFLIPPEFETFRLVAERAVVADWKAFPFQENAMVEWANRMCQEANVTLCNYKTITPQQIISGYRTLTSDKISILSQDYRFKYFVSEINYPIFKKLYSNYFYVYQISD